MNLDSFRRALEPALVQQLAQPRGRYRADMRVGQMGERKHRPFCNQDSMRVKINGAPRPRPWARQLAAEAGEEVAPGREAQLFIVGTSAAAT